jgi:hypothetical protein
MYYARRQKRSVKSRSRVPGTWKFNFKISNAVKLVVVAVSNVPLMVSQLVEMRHRNRPFRYAWNVGNVALISMD